jgi:hypothetical protein
MSEAPNLCQQAGHQDRDLHREWSRPTPDQLNPSEGWGTFGGQQREDRVGELALQLHKESMSLRTGPRVRVHPGRRFHHGPTHQRVLGHLLRSPASEPR